MSFYKNDGVVSMLLLLAGLSVIFAVGCSESETIYEDTEANNSGNNEDDESNTEDEDVNINDIDTEFDPGEGEKFESACFSMPLFAERKWKTPSSGFYSVNFESNDGEVGDVTNMPLAAVFDSEGRELACKNGCSHGTDTGYIENFGFWAEKGEVVTLAVSPMEMSAPNCEPTIKKVACGSESWPSFECNDESDTDADSYTARFCPHFRMTDAQILKASCALDDGGVQLAANWQVPFDGEFYFDVYTDANYTIAFYLEDCLGEEQYCISETGDSDFSLVLEGGRILVVMVEIYECHFDHKTSWDLDVDITAER